MHRADLKKWLHRHLGRRPKGVKLADDTIIYDPNNDEQFDYVYAAEQLADEYGVELWVQPTRKS